MSTRVLLVAVSWLALIGVVAYGSYAFETTPGGAAPAPAGWPADSALARAGDRPTVVLFAHPECGCTGASLAELAGVVTELAEPPRVLVVFTGEGDPSTSASWQAAGRIPGARRLRDDGREARRFGARTSGHVVVYDARGALRFTGGLTGSRGHVGDNVGRRAVLDALRGRAGEPSHGVFGCSLEDER